MFHKLKFAITWWSYLSSFRLITITIPWDFLFLFLHCCVVFTWGLFLYLFLFFCCCDVIVYNYLFCLRICSKNLYDMNISMFYCLSKSLHSTIPYRNMDIYFVSTIIFISYHIWLALYRNTTSLTSNKYSCNKEEKIH